MSYRNYVIAAYCVFALVLLWDYVAPRWQLRQQWRAARMRVARGDAVRQATSLDPRAGLDGDIENQFGTGPGERVGSGPGGQP